MEIYPAIDLRSGKVVRLQHGDPKKQTTFDDDPLAVARRWAAAGARWLHVVNLDGAIHGAGSAAEANLRLLPALAAVGPRVQFGGGLRSLAEIEMAIRAGATRIILGSAAVENPDLVERAVQRFGTQAIVVALDARDGIARTHGWQSDSGLTAVALGQRLGAMGVRLALYTDIARDGVLAGVNLEATVDLAQRTGLRVIASGGAASLVDVRRLAERAQADVGIDGLVIGRALYEGTIDLRSALKEVDETHARQTRHPLP